jgi:predicted dehydrogenase
MAPVRLGVVAAGKRSRTLMEHAYAIGEQEYLGSERADGYPHSIYRAFGVDEYDWVEDVRDIDPEFTAVMSPSAGSREAARDICREYGDDPDLFADFDAFLDAEFDAVVVGSPNDAHADAVVPLLDRGVDVYCEKPLAATLDGHDRIIDVHDDSEALLFAGFQRRLAPYYRRLGDLVESVTGRLGMMSHVEVRDPFHIAGTDTGAPGYRYSQERSGGALLEKNCHDFDLFNWYADADPVRVTAFGGQHALRESTDILDQATVNIQYGDGTVASLELCLYVGVGDPDIYDVRGRKRSEYRGPGGVVRAPGDGTVEVDTRGERREIEVGIAGSHGGDLFAVHRFLRCLRGDAAPPVTPREAKKAAAVAFAGEASAAADGEPVEITDAYDLRR